MITAEAIGRRLAGLDDIGVGPEGVHRLAWTTIADHVRLWLDGRAADPAALERWIADVDEAAAELDARTGVNVSIQIASRSPGVEFSARLRAELLRAAEALIGSEPPSLICYAGHDAGVLAPRTDAAMVFVRNETGISHSPQETVALEDAAVAANVVARTLSRLA